MAKSGLTISVRTVILPTFWLSIAILKVKSFFFIRINQGKWIDSSAKTNIITYQNKSRLFVFVCWMKFKMSAT
jgi:hypothetical protein